jgi:hypothetical protein
LQINHIGEILYSQDIDLTDNLDLGSIIIQKVRELQSITVTGQKKLIERKVDRLIFNVENSVAASGGDALDALRITPGIRVQNDQISMIGKSEMSVMVNDRLVQLSEEDLVNYLRSIPSDNIKSIEVITTPPAKYDAEGNSGIVNIQLKKAKKDSWNTILRSSYKQGVYPTGIVGGNFNYQKNKIGISYDVDAYKSKMIETNKYRYFYPDDTWDNNLKYIKRDDYFGSAFNASYDITPTFKAGTQHMGYFADRSQDEFINSDILYNNGNIERIETQGISDLDLSINTFNLNLTNKSSSTENYIMADIDYFIYDYERNNRFSSNSKSSNSFIDADNKNELLIKNVSAKIDAHLALKKIAFNYGAKMSITENISDLNTVFYDENANIMPQISQSDIFKYYEDNYAAYIDAKKEFGKKWEVKAGLRAEYVITKAISKESETVNKDKLNWFPTVYIQYMPNENHNFSIAVNSRINRPSYLIINPNKWYYSTNSYKTGNPFLEPSYTYNMELSHSYRSLLNSTFYISKVTNSFSGDIVIHNEQEDQQISTRENYKDIFYWGLIGNVNAKLFNFMTLSYNFDVSHNKVNAFSPYMKARYNYWEANTSLNSSFVLSENLTAELNTYYYFPTNNNYNSYSAYLQLNAGVKYVFPDKKLQLSLVFNDILKSDKPVNTIFTDNIKQTYEKYFDSQYFRLTLVYKLGGKIKPVENREGSNVEELKRTSSEN